MNKVLYTQNVHYRRAETDAAWERHVAHVIAAAHRRDQIGWALAMFCVWVLAMVVDTYRTFYAAWTQTGNIINGLSAFIGMGVLFTGMCFAVWKGNR